MKHIRIDVEDKEFGKLEKAKREHSIFVGRKLTWKQLFLYAVKDSSYSSTLSRINTQQEG